MIALPIVHSTEHTATGTRIALTVPADLPYFAGHFPNLPVLPGVVQLSWAIELGRKYVSVAGDFHALQNVKFMRVIQPDEHIVLLLDYHIERSALHFEYRVEQRSCSVGTALFGGTGLGA